LYHGRYEKARRNGASEVLCFPCMLPGVGRHGRIGISGKGVNRDV